jgi:chorismate-pyruvate lyase
MQSFCPNTFICPVQQPEPEDPFTSLIKRILLCADGSTTRLLQSIVGQTMTVKVHHQTLIQHQDLPSTIATFFPCEGQFLYRISSLYSGQTLVSTNVVYTCIGALPETLQMQLSAGTIPLGTLISHAETRRDLLRATEQCFCNLQNLFEHFSIPPLFYPMKEYKIIQQEKCWFYVCELFHLEQIVQAARLSNPLSQKFLEGVEKR